MNNVQINFTIIIPHYNIPSLLIRCLNSIPVREDIQVVVVDDCSPDFELYKSKYVQLSRPYLELYQTPKGGSAGRARNMGIEKAKGKWVIFMDADDLFADNMEVLLDEIVDRNEDLLFFNYKSVYSDDLKKDAKRNYYQKYIQRYKKTGDDSDLRYNFESFWGKIIKRSLIESNNILCDETRYGNDVYLSAQCGYFAKSIAVVDKVLFIVTERAGSLASSQFGDVGMSFNEMYIRTDVSTRKINLLYKVYPVCMESWLGLPLLKRYPLKSGMYILLTSIKYPKFLCFLVSRVFGKVMK